MASSPSITGMVMSNTAASIRESPVQRGLDFESLADKYCADAK
jgi:hypothetical protein